MVQSISRFLEKYVTWLYIPSVGIIDIVEIILIAFVVYRLMVWIKNTKAWMLLKGIIVLAIFIFVAAILQMNTILYLAKMSISVLATAAVVVFQPELRRALEKLGQRNFISTFLFLDRSKENDKFNEDTIDSLIEATYAMGRTKTGALIVLEQGIKLTEYEATGISLDCLVSSQILLNIFEHNTPLHDGAIIVRENRIMSATCYLPLSDNMGVSKQLGTRHRAAIGISEVSDSLTIVVSEETGAVSLAIGGQLIRNIAKETLKERLDYIQSKNTQLEGKKRFVWKGRQKDER